MTESEIKKLLDQESGRYAWDRRPAIPQEHTKQVFNHAISFYEQSILPEVLKEKEQDYFNKLSNAVYEAVNEVNAERAKLMVENYRLGEQLSQLQSSMEEEKRKAFEAGKAINEMNNGFSGKCIGYMRYDKENDDFIIEPLDEDESTESGNLNKQ